MAAAIGHIGGVWGFQSQDAKYFRRYKQKHQKSYQDNLEDIKVKNLKYGDSYRAS